MMKKEEIEKIRQTLLTIFSKLNNPSTVTVAHDSIKKLIIENETNETKMNYILSHVSDDINTLKKGEKKESIKLLSSIATANKDISPYLSRILTIIQSNISDDNASIFTIISSTFGEIVDSSLGSNSEMTERYKTIYELLQGFCIYNMKQEAKANQICGSLCLTALIETCSMILQPAYMKYIWENIILFIDKPVFNAKSELLNSLISLIFASENMFKPFSTVTLYKILDFLTDNDWFKRKLALNVIYTLVIYCQDEILPLKGHIVEFLRVLKSDKVKEVREVCMQTLKLFNELENSSESENEKKKSIQVHTPRRNNKYSPNVSFTNENLNKSKVIPNKKSQKNTLDDLNISNISGIHKTNENCETNRNKKGTVNSNNIPVPSSKIQTERSTTPSRGRRKITQTINKVNDISNDDNNLSQVNNSKKDVNRKEDNTFVNDKMVLKRDPSYSIFKTNKNREFFSNAPKNDGEIQVKVKEKKNNELINTENTASNYRTDDYVNYVKMKPGIENIKTEEVEREDDSNNLIKIKDRVDLKTANNIQEKANPLFNSSPTKNSHSNTQKSELTITDILKQMKSLSDKQIYLIDSLEKIQTSTQEQFDFMNERIAKLEKTVYQLVTTIKTSGMNSMGNLCYNTGLSTKYETNVINKEDFESVRKGCQNIQNVQNVQNIWVDILQELKNKNPNSAFNLALNSEDFNLIKLIEKINLSQLKDINQVTLEDSISKLMPHITNGQSTGSILFFLKNLLINLNCNFKSKTLQNIKNALLYISSNNKTLSNEDMVDINILLSYINSNSIGVSNLITSFAIDSN